MHLRPYIAADIPQCTTIQIDAFEDNELFNFLAPNRASHPLSWRQRSLNLQRSRFYRDNLWAYVCVADADDDFANEGEILGYASWTRHTSVEDAAYDPWTRHLNAAERIESWLLWVELKWEEKLRGNPAVSWANKDAFMRSAMASTNFAPIRGATHWYLQSLVVAPKYQRRGVARQLVNWGLQHAKTESEERVAKGKAPVPVLLISSPPGLHLYRSLGFKVLSWEDESFMEVAAEGGSNMVWDLTGYWIQDRKYDPPVRRGIVEAIYTARAVDTNSN